MHDDSPVLRSLERIAERGTDITPQVYARFFARCPAAAALFGDEASGSVHGKMLNELVQTVLDLGAGKPYVHTLLETGFNDHDNWGVTAPMYRDFFDALLDTLAEVLQPDWDAATAAAWQAALAAILAQLDGRSPPAR